MLRQLKYLSILRFFSQDLLGFFLTVPSALLLHSHGNARKKFLRTYGILGVDLIIVITTFLQICI